MAKVLCVLFPDPSTGYPPTYPRDRLPVITGYPNGQTLPTPTTSLSFTPGELLGSVSGELGLGDYLRQSGHQLIITSDKEGDDRLC